MMVRADEGTQADQCQVWTICMIRSRSGMPIATPPHRKERLRAALEKPNLRRTGPHATSETGRTLTLLLGFDVALMRRSTNSSIS